MVSRFRSRPLPMPGIRPIHASCNHAIMQSCNQADLSLAAHRRGATKPIPGGRSSCVFPRHSSVSMRLMPMPRSQADRRCVCCRSRCQKVAPFSMKRGRAIRGRVGPDVVVDSPRESNSGPPATRPIACPRGPDSHKAIEGGVVEYIAIEYIQHCCTSESASNFAGWVGGAKMNSRMCSPLLLLQDAHRGLP
jgi:hypothetical protein